MLPFFIKAIQLGLGVIVLNPNTNSVKVFLVSSILYDIDSKSIRWYNKTTNSS